MIVSWHRADLQMVWNLGMSALFSVHTGTIIADHEIWRQLHFGDAISNRRKFSLYLAERTANGSLHRLTLLLVGDDLPTADMVVPFPAGPLSFITRLL